MSGDTKIVTLSELQEHNTAKSLWIAINNHVYDITRFLDEHPGGEEVLLEQAGQRATEAFEDVGHSNEARELMKEYHIGEMAKGDHEGDYDPSDPSEKGSSIVSKALSWFIPAAIFIGIFAVAIYRMMSN